MATCLPLYLFECRGFALDYIFQLPRWQRQSGDFVRKAIMDDGSDAL